VVVYVRPSERGTRVGFVCARRVGGAVTRNRARRVLKEAWRAVAARAHDGYDVVFVAQPAIVGATRDELIREMVDALADAGVMSR
jgi:ribonuclease P protein component